MPDTNEAKITLQSVKLKTLKITVAQHKISWLQRLIHKHQVLRINNKFLHLIHNQKLLQKSNMQD